MLLNISKPHFGLFSSYANFLQLDNVGEGASGIMSSSLDEGGIDSSTTREHETKITTQSKRNIRKENELFDLAMGVRQLYFSCLLCG